MILVANADDAGADLARNRGILRSAREGIVRSASVLVGLEGAADFVAQWRHVEGVGIGLHLNLTEGAPLRRGLRTIVGADGRFLAKRDLWARARAGALDPAEISVEIQAQWAALESLQVRPTHLDGHNHVHLFPQVALAVAGAVPPGIWIRCPRDLAASAQEGPSGMLPADPYADPQVCARTLGALAARALDLGWSRFRSADRFVGLSLPRGYCARDIQAILEPLAQDSSLTVEFMTHPGERCDGSLPYSASPDREREARALADPDLLQFIRARGIRLASFGDLS